MVIGSFGCFCPPSDGLLPTPDGSMAPTYLPTRGPDREIGASPSFSSEVWMMDIHLFRIIESEEREAAGE